MFLLWLGLEAMATTALGWLALANLPDAAKRRIFEGDLLWALSVSAGVVLVALLELALFLAGAASAAAHAGALVATIAALGARAWWLGVPRGDARELAPYGLYLVWLLLIVSITPGYATGYAEDWRLYWGNAGAYLGEIPLERYRAPVLLEYLVKRTPLLSLYASFWLTLAGPTFPMFQVACLAPSSLLFLAVRVFAGRFGRPSAREAVAALLVIAPALARTATVPEPKALGAALALLALAENASARELAHPERWRDALTGFLAVAAIAAHPSFAFYVAWPFIDRARRREGAGLWLGAGATALALLVPWAAWAAATFGPSSVLIPPRTISGDEPFSLGSYVRAQAGMIASTAVAPVGLFREAARSPGPWLDAWANPILRAYDQTFLFGASLSAAIASAAIAARRGREPGPRAPWAPLAIGAAACFAAHLTVDDPKGHALNLAAPLFLAVLAKEADLLVASRAALALALAGGAVELVATRVLVIRVTAASTWPVVEQTSPGLLGKGLVVAGVEGVVVLALYGWAVRREAVA